MLELKPVNYTEILPFVADFRKKTDGYDTPPEGSYTIGIYVDNELSGYYILQEYTDASVEIQQGYLKPSAQHRKLSYAAMRELEKKLKAFGYTEIFLDAHRSLKAYQKFMTNLGFKIKTISFSKEI